MNNQETLRETLNCVFFRCGSVTAIVGEVVHAGVIDCRIFVELGWLEKKGIVKRLKTVMWC